MSRGNPFNDLKESLLRRLDATRNFVAAPDQGITKKFIALLRAGQFHFIEEPWLHTGKTMFNAVATGLPPAQAEQRAGEMLLRTALPSGENGRAIQALYKTPDPSALDHFIVLSVLEQRQGDRRENSAISINISGRAVENAAFWDDLHHMIDYHFGHVFPPERIIFECLEDHKNPKPDYSALERMRARGYRFALDDLSHTNNDALRLRRLGPVMDFIKIDGHTLTLAEQGRINLHTLIDRVEQHAPTARLIFEWVKDTHQADRLRRTFNGTYVQGQNLPHSHDVFRMEMNALKGYHDRDKTKSIGPVLADFWIAASGLALLAMTPFGIFNNPQKKVSGSVDPSRRAI